MNNIIKLKIIVGVLISLLFINFMVGCEKPELTVNELKDSYNFPNPFSPSDSNTSLKSTTLRSIIINNTGITRVEVTIKIKDISNQLVWYFNREVDISNTAPGSENTIDIIWSGYNNKGEIVSQGVYNAQIIIKTIETTSAFGGDVLTTNFNIAVE